MVTSVRIDQCERSRPFDSVLQGRDEHSRAAPGRCIGDSRKRPDRLRHVHPARSVTFRGARGTAGTRCADLFVQCDIACRARSGRTTTSRARCFSRPPEDRRCGEVRDTPWVRSRPSPHGVRDRRAAQRHVRRRLSPGNVRDVRRRRLGSTPAQGGGNPIANEGDPTYRRLRAAHAATSVAGDGGRAAQAARSELLARLATRRYVRGAKRDGGRHEQSGTCKPRQQIIHFRERQTRPSAPPDGDRSHRRQYRPRCVRCRSARATRRCGDRHPHGGCHHWGRHRRLHDFVLRHARVCAVPGCRRRHSS